MPRLPGVNHLDAVRALKKAGFRVRRQGKHIVMSDGTRIVTIPRHNPVNAFTKGDDRAGCRADDRRVPPVALRRQENDRR
jgi:predicted RNA binding protein YcfA (HicA-like mRNA interferase family)